MLSGVFVVSLVLGALCIAGGYRGQGGQLLCWAAAVALGGFTWEGFLGVLLLAAAAGFVLRLVLGK